MNILDGMNVVDTGNDMVLMWIDKKGRSGDVCGEFHKVLRN